MTTDTIQAAVNEYVEKEPMWAEAGGNPAELAVKIAADNGLPFPEFWSAILARHGM